MPESRYRVLAIASHPIQYGAPVFRLLAQHPQLDFHVAYCSLRGAEATHDPEFGAIVKWDIPLLDGYAWTHVPNRGSGAESFCGLRNPGLWKLVREREFDAVICHVGYVRASFWIGYLAAASRGIPFIFGTDASMIEPRDGRAWKHISKRMAWPLLFRLAGQVLTASSAGYDMMRSLGIPEDRISMTLDTVDNDWWVAQAAQADCGGARASWGVDAKGKIILFCGKLQPWKRPLDVLRAFAKALIPRATLVFAGEGPLRSHIEAEASVLGVRERVRIMGFVNQSQLPAVYRASDLMVIPSEYEPFGLVVNEAMLCGCPVVASDKVGAVGDLIDHDLTGFIYPCGDVPALAAVIQRAFADSAHLSIISNAALARIGGWSPRASVAALVDAVTRAVARSGRVPKDAGATAVEPSAAAKPSLPTARRS